MQVASVRSAGLLAGGSALDSARGSAGPTHESGVLQLLSAPGAHFARFPKLRAAAGMNYTPHLAMHAIANASRHAQAPRSLRPHNTWRPSADILRERARSRTRKIMLVMLVSGAVLSAPAGFALFASGARSSRCRSTGENETPCSGAVQLSPIAAHVASVAKFRHAQQLCITNAQQGDALRIHGVRTLLLQHTPIRAPHCRPWRHSDLLSHLSRRRVPRGRRLCRFASNEAYSRRGTRIL